MLLWPGRSGSLLASPSSHPGPSQVQHPHTHPLLGLPWVDWCPGPLCPLTGDKELAGSGETGVFTGNKVRWEVLGRVEQAPGEAVGWGVVPQPGMRYSPGPAAPSIPWGLRSQSPPPTGCSAVSSGVCGFLGWDTSVGPPGGDQAGLWVMAFSLETHSTGGRWLYHGGSTCTNCYAGAKRYLGRGIVMSSQGESGKVGRKRGV